MIPAAKALLVRRYYDELMPALREAARLKGYALTAHGSLARDIDLVAIPWTEQAVPAQDLVEALLKEVQEATKAAGHEEGYIGFEGDGSKNLVGEKKPHGRRAWSIHVDGTYIDLSVMPRST